MGSGVIRAAALVGMLCLHGTASAAQRVALVIGNGAYRHDRALANPKNDARGVATVLGNLGFKVTQGADLGRSAMERAVLEFGRQTEGSEIALVYYAGHGLEVGGKNYLLPVDARLTDELALRTEAVDMDLVLEATAPARTRLLFIDACRNNPLANRMKVRANGRSVGRGLARVEAVNNTLIAFATAPGTVAEDGKGTNSPFAAALMRHLPTPGLEIQQVLRMVRQSVAGATGNKQVPWDSSQLFDAVVLKASPEGPAAASAALSPSAGGGSVFTVADAASPGFSWGWMLATASGIVLLLGGSWTWRARFAPRPIPAGPSADGAVPVAATPAGAPAPQSPPPAQEARDPRQEAEPAAIELAFWSSIKSSDDPELFRAYLAAYPQGRFAALAAIKVRERPATTSGHPEPTYEDDLWQLAYKSRTPQALRGYLHAFPEGRHRKLAEAFLSAEQEPQEIDVAQAVPANEVPRPRSAAAANPGEAVDEDSQWQVACRSGSPRALRAYLQKFPAGRYQEEAKALLAAQVPPALRDQDAPSPVAPDAKLPGPWRALGLAMMVLSVLSYFLNPNVWLTFLIAPMGFFVGLFFTFGAVQRKDFTVRGGFVLSLFLVIAGIFGLLFVVA